MQEENKNLSKQQKPEEGAISSKKEDEQSESTESPVEHSNKPEIEEEQSMVEPEGPTYPAPLESNVENQTENMEVHHHGHVHHQKKWKEYLFQFFMLFLAVFCGFLAEYQLEHIIENQREKQYVKSFIADLEADTAHIADLLRRYDFKHKNVDTFLSALKNPNSLHHPDLLYKYTWVILYPLNLIATDRTIEQLKNSGGLRLIRKQSASDSIISYSLRIKEIINHQGYLGTGMIDLTTPFFQIFDVNQMEYPGVLIDPTLLPKPKTKSLLSQNPELLNVMFNKLAILKGAERIHIEMLEQLNVAAINYIIFLRKQYHLD